MTLTTLNERIENAKNRIEKKQNTIVKKTALIEKKRAMITKLGFNPDDEACMMRDNADAFWARCDIETLTEDIERGEKEIIETKAKLEKYEKQLAGELERESMFIKDVPETMKRMQAELVSEWNEWDIARRDRIRNDYKEMPYSEFAKKYNRGDKEFMYMTNDQIQRINERDAKCLVINLYNRVKDITGEVVDWSGIEATIGTRGITVLNGIVIGKEGRARVESIYAGGYNIQRFHVRVLVHEIM